MTAERLGELPCDACEEYSRADAEETNVLRSHQGIRFLQNRAAQGEPGCGTQKHDENSFQAMARFCRR